MAVTVIATGGTIDCVRDGGVLKVGEKDLTPYIGRHERVSPFRILSENVTPAHWTRLVETVRGIPSGGVLITHGSDTLPYTAAALAFCLADYGRPVVLTAADAPLDEPDSNAAANLAGAMRVIDSGVPGVYVSYARRGREADIFFGARMNEASDFTGVYTAPHDLLYAADGGRTVCGRPLTGAPLPPRFAPVAAYRFVPGVTYSAPPEVPVLIMGTHSGTAAEAELTRLARRGPVWLAGGTAGLVYESKDNVRGRVRFLDNIAWPAAYIKTSLVYGTYAGEAAAEPMTENRTGEFFA